MIFSPRTCCENMVIYGNDRNSSEAHDMRGCTRPFQSLRYRAGVYSCSIGLGFTMCESSYCERLTRVGALARDWGCGSGLGFTLCGSLWCVLSTRGECILVLGRIIVAG
jgi:hypothetical protein